MVSAASTVRWPADQAGRSRRLRSAAAGTARPRAALAAGRPSGGFDRLSEPSEGGETGIVNSPRRPDAAGNEVKSVGLGAGRAEAHGAAAERLDDGAYPAYTMGRAAEMLGVTAGFLRALGEAGLLAPQRSTGRHRRYSRNELELAARARVLVDQGMSVAAAARILALEDELTDARRTIIVLRQRLAAD